MKRKSKEHLGWRGRLSHRLIKEINKDIIKYYFHEKGGKFISGPLLIEIYEKKYGIEYHGFQENSTYEIFVANSPRGWHALVTEIKKVEAA